MNKIRYGIIGAGMMGREHIQNIKLLDNSEVTFLVEPNLEQQKLSLELAPNAKLCTQLQEAIKSTDVDAWVIASPNFTHIEVLLTLFKYDARPILVEKPICTCIEDCKIIEEKADSYKAPIWVAMEYRYMQAVAKMKERVFAGDVGDVKMFSIREHRFPFLKKVGDWNRFNKNSGGTMVEKCCHFFDLMNLVLKDDAVRVFASGNADVNFLEERYDGNTPDIIDNAFVIVEYKSGLRASLDLCMFCDGSYFQEEISVIGDKAKIECKIPGPDRLWYVDDLNKLGPITGFVGEHRKSQIIFSPRSPKNPIVEEIDIDENLQAVGDHNGSTYFQHKKFNELIQGKGDIEVSVSDGIKAVKIGLAAEESIRTHKVLEV